MKLNYVKTSNYEKFVTAVNSVENGAAFEARLINLAGQPGTGKTRAVDHLGAERNAIYINGRPGMSLSYVRDLLAYELGVGALKGFQLQKAINETMHQRRAPIILDEAQHGLESKARVIDYLRSITQEVGALMILVCHTSEKHHFAEHKLAHIATRISAVVDFKTADLADTHLYVDQLCEIRVDDGIKKMVLEQSQGRYRLMTSAINTLEMIGKSKGKDSLIESDVRGLMLCEDAMKSLRKGAKS